MHTNTIKTILTQYRSVIAEYELQEALPMREESTAIRPTLKRKISVIQSWLSLLSDEERFIISKHLIDKLSWTMVIIEYEKRWGTMQCRHERTLKRMQARALSRIQEFIERTGRASEIEVLFCGINSSRETCQLGV